MDTLKHQVAVVTGASSGIGRACCLALAEEGVTVCLLGRKIDELHGVENEIKQVSPLSKVFKVDLAVDGEIDKAAELIRKEFGRVHILVHSAGVFSMGRLDEAPIEDFDYQYKINVRAPFLLTQKILPMLVEDHGQIAFVNSTVAMGAKNKLSQYCATKSALKAVADSLRLEVNSQGIRVLTLYPGRTASPMQEKVCELEGSAFNPELMLRSEHVAKLLVSTLAMPRDTEVTDIYFRPMKKYDANVI